MLVLGGGGGGGSSASSVASGQPGIKAAPGSTVVEDAQGDFNARACNPAQANQPCTAPANAVAITALYLDIKTARITQPSPRQIEFTIVLYGPPPKAPPYSYLGYFWQFSGGCLGGATGPVKKDALGVTWNGREWAGGWSQIVSCNPLTSTPGDAVKFTISGNTISVRVPLDDLITRSGESIEWFAGVRLIAPSQTFPNTISLDLAPDVNAINPNPPPFFLRPQSPATWVNK